MKKERQCYQALSFFFVVFIWIETGETGIYLASVSQ